VLAWLAAAGPAAAQEEQPAAPQGADAQIEAIREMVLYARYQEATPAVDALLARTDLSASQRNAGLETRAVLLIARRRVRDARAVLEELYARDPDHRLGYRDAGPNVRDEFERARDAHPAQAAVALEDQTPDSIERRVAPTLVVGVAGGADAIQEIRVAYRNAEGGFERTLMRTSADGGASTARARIPLREGGEAYSLEYYVEALAPSGFVLGTLGSADAPLSVAVPAEELVARVDPAALRVGPGEGGQTDGGGVDGGVVAAVVIAILVAGGVGAGVGIYFGTQGPGNGSLGGGTL
jgi:hypothetical protein